MVEGETRSGFKFKYDAKVLDDMRLVEAISATEAPGFKSLQATLDVANMVLGAQQKEKLYKHLEKKYGTATISDCRNELVDIINASETGKNS